MVGGDGGGRYQLSDEGVFSRALDWSPDGATIGFAERGIQLLNAVDGSLTSLPTSDDDGNRNPSYDANGVTWSPDGSQIAFSARGAYISTTSPRARSRSW